MMPPPVLTVYLQPNVEIPVWSRYPDGELVLMVPKAEWDSLRTERDALRSQLADFQRGAAEEARQGDLARAEVSSLKERLAAAQAVVERYEGVIAEKTELLTEYMRAFRNRDAVVDAARVASRSQGRAGYGKAMADLAKAVQALDHS